MPSKPKKLTVAEIEAFEAKRDIGQEILQSIKDMKAGRGKVVVLPAIEARTHGVRPAPVPMSYRAWRWG